jgi:hypothetical protein
MSNTSEWGASDGPGKKPQGTGGTSKGPGGTSMADLSGQVSDAIREGAREMKEQASNVAESAKGLASQAGEKLLSSVEEQKAAGADFVSGMAGAIRRAANEFDRDVPQAAQYMRLAADQVGAVSDAFRRSNVSRYPGAYWRPGCQRLLPRWTFSKNARRRTPQGRPPREMRWAAFGQTPEHLQPTG